MKKLFQIPLDPETAKTFTANLGLSTSGFRTPPTSFQAICQCWLSQGSAPGDLDQLVEALVITRGLGRHTSCLCSPGKLWYVFYATVTHWTVYVCESVIHVLWECPVEKSAVGGVLRRLVHSIISGCFCSCPLRNWKFCLHLWVCGTMPAT